MKTRQLQSAAMDDQVKLPLRVAFGVVMQGIRIRFGRSLITVAGIGLGIAFLMSTLTGQIVKSAVHEEDRIRADTRRMVGFLAAEMGPPQGRVIGVIQAGALDEVESRLARQLAESQLERLQWCHADPASSLPAGLEPVIVAMEAVGREASCVLLMGVGAEPAGLQLPSALFEQAREKILAITRPEAKVGEVAGVSVVRLARELFPEEAAKAEQERRTARFRTIWIVVISLLVTIGGITNAMLMSVMERFREIGTMKCLGALSSFVRWVFLLEAALMGAAGAIAGAFVGAAGSIVLFGISYGFGELLSTIDFVLLAEYFGLSVLAGVSLSILAAIYPASVAASMVPATALSTNV